MENKKKPSFPEPLALGDTFSLVYRCRSFLEGRLSHDVISYQSDINPTFASNLPYNLITAKQFDFKTKIYYEYQVVKIL